MNNFTKVNILKLIYKNKIMLWGIDLGGTKIEGIVLKSYDDPKEVSRIRINTEAQKGYNHVLNRIKELVLKLKKDSGDEPKKIGIGTPGTIDPKTKLLKNSNSTNLNNKPIKIDLEKILNLKIKIENDANCFALAETHFGSVKEIIKNPKVVFGVIIGTGVGGGIVVDGKSIFGHQGIGGEWGHTIIEQNGEKCYCGKTGCVETVISGPALEKYYNKLSNKKLSLEKIYSLYKKNDTHATKTINRMLFNFGKGISNVINIIDPDIIVIGGGLSHINEIYNPDLNFVKNFVFNPTFKTKIIKPKLGDSAGVYGAAFL